MLPDSSIAVLVLGSPRSGTSAVSHVLSELGVEFGRPERFVDPGRNSHNPIFFELQALNDLNNRILAAAGIQYELFDYFKDPRGLDVPNASSFVDEIQRLIEDELGSGPLIGLKDPRFILTLPLWKKALREHGYVVRCVLTTRDFDATVRSNAEVNGFSAGHNRRLVKLSEQLSALQLTPEDALLIDYDRLVEAPLEQSTRLAAWLGLNRDPEAASRIVSGRLKHQSSPAGVRSEDLDDFRRARIDEFATWRAGLEQVGLIELVEARRAEVNRLATELAAAHEQKWKEGVAAHAEIGRLSTALAEAKRQLLVALTQKADEGTRWAAEVSSLRSLLHQAEQEALAANTQKAIEGRQFHADIQKLREEFAQAEIELVRAQQAADETRLRMQARIQGLERRQRWGVLIGGSILFAGAVVVAIFLGIAQ